MDEKWAKTIELMNQSIKHVLRGAGSQLNAAKAKALNKIKEEDTSSPCFIPPFYIQYYSICTHILFDGGAASFN
ncbi:hypothetical protein KY290_021824 [Solanum tuberosum]|uniref:Uncharacterized protein n=1 Tax=Solanum tuberosum TaxID=4113 RepID=A0ABQ7V4M8_SOLTU|nr:hypothetical protein KY289_020991 [Solanum tuberosum]KAH0758331.1 hypothetical protein KY290_021824 [Solanum tuberosum]